MDNKLKLLSLFSGIGAFEKGLENIEYELVNYCENNQIAANAYSIIHNVREDLNLGDITQIDIKSLPKDIDLITHGSPCQSFSSCGKQAGGDKGSGTQSSLMWHTVEIVNWCRPRYVIWENVKNVLSKKHKHNFDLYIKELERIGYTSYHKVFNSKDMGTPMNRERLFVVSIYGNHTPFEFPKNKLKVKDINEYLECGLSDDNIKVAKNIKPGCREEFLEHYDKILSSDKDGYDCRAKSDFQDKKVGIKISYCIRANSTNTHILDGKTIRKLTSKEFWRLINFKDEDYYLVKENTSISDTNMCKLAGNSIDVNVIKPILETLFIKNIHR